MRDFGDIDYRITALEMRLRGSEYNAIADAFETNRRGAHQKLNEAVEIICKSIGMSSVPDLSDVEKNRGQWRKNIAIFRSKLDKFRRMK